MVLLLTLAHAADVGALARVGEALPGAVVERVEVHPEYERYWLRYPDGARVPAEATRATPGAEGHCTAGGVTLYLREELAEGHPADAAAPMAALCGRLAEHPPTLRERGVFVPAAEPEPVEVVAEVPDPTRPVLFRPAHVLLAAVAGLAAWAARRLGALGTGDRRDLALVAVAAVAAGALSPAGTFNGGGAAYEKIVLAWGVDLDNPYGDGFSAWMGPLLAVLGRAPAWVFLLDRGVGATVPPLLWGLVRLHADRRAALGAGLACAGLPILLRTAPTEAMHVSVTAFALLALVAASAFRVTGEGALGLLAATAGGFVAQIRPEAVPFAGVVIAFAWGVRSPWRGPAAALLVGLVGARVAGMSLHQDVLRSGGLSTAAFWATAFTPRLVPPPHLAAGSTFWNGGLTPAGWWPFVLLGVVAAPASLRARLLVWWVLVELPVLQKASPVADAVRLQLPAAPLWVVLVGAGAAALPGRLAPVVPGLLGAAWFAAQPGWLRWANHAEFDVLAELVPTLGPADVVLFDDPGSRAGKFARVMQVLGPASWMRASDWLAGADARGPTRWWRGVGEDPEAARRIEERCTVVPDAVRRVTGRSDEDLHLARDGVEIGFWRVESCRPGD